jgi:hypothetical protein
LEQKKTLKERAKRMAGIALVFGLLLEIWEAVKEDREVAKATLHVEELRKANDELEALIQPRRIIPEQRIAILNRLRAFRGKKCRVSVVYNEPDLETERFAGDIWQILQVWPDVKTESQFVTFPPMNGVPAGSPSGVWLSARNPLPDGAKEIVEALVVARVLPPNIAIACDSTMPENLLKITVWPKPLPEMVLTNSPVRLTGH